MKGSVTNLHEESVGGLAGQDLRNVGSGVRISRRSSCSSRLVVPTLMELQQLSERRFRSYRPADDQGLDRELFCS
jgi:hypothetical protein